MNGCNIVLALAVLASPAFAAPRARAPHVEAALISEVAALAPGKTAWIGLKLEMQRGWHVYWRNPGDSGEAPVLKWTVPGHTVGPVEWPVPERIPLGPLVNFGYSGTVLLMAPLAVAPGASGKVRIQLDASWLVCHEECVGGDVKLDLELPVGEPSPSADAPLFERTRARVPRPLPADRRATFSMQGKTLELSIEPFPEPEAPVFFPIDPEQVEAAAPQSAKRTARGLTLALTRAEALRTPPQVLRGVLVAGSAFYEVTAARAGKRGRSR